MSTAASNTINTRINTNINTNALGIQSILNNQINEPVIRFTSSEDYNIHSYQESFLVIEKASVLSYSPDVYIDECFNNPIKEAFSATIDKIKNSAVYQNSIGTAAKRTLGISLLATVGYAGAVIGTNIDPIIKTFGTGDIAGGALYSMMTLANCYYAYLAVIQPSVLHISSMFLAKQEKPVIKDDFVFPKVTVQIPCRNEPFEVVLENALSHAMKMDYPKELIQIQVIDNSDPGKYEELEEYCNNNGIDFIHRDGTEGFKSRNLNIGLKTATGDYVLVLDADNRVDEDFLKMMAFEIKQDEKISAVFADIDLWNQKENLYTDAMGTLKNNVNPLLSTMDRHGMNLFNGFGVLLDKAKMEEVGNWAEDSIGEDYDMSFSRL